MAARVARPVLGIVDDAGEQAAGLLAIVGLRLRHQPFGVEAASGRIVSALHRALECGAGAGCLGGRQCLRVKQRLFRLAAYIGMEVDLVGLLCASNNKVPIKDG